MNNNKEKRTKVPLGANVYCILNENFYENPTYIKAQFWLKFGMLRYIYVSLNYKSHEYVVMMNISSF